MSVETEVLIIGGGFSGLLTAVRLIEMGLALDDLRIVERGGDFGGTWYWNRYPGVRCDVESYVYLPLLEEIGTIPGEKYAKGAEIFQHCRRTARKFDLYPRAIFQTSVTDVRWSEDSLRWVVQTDRKDEIRARFLIVGTGVLSKPKLPGIDGIEQFEGAAFHASRWDYQYTGGDGNGNLTGLIGKRAAVIGTGATAIQCVPVIADYADHLYVFQRTPSAVDRRNNHATDREWFLQQPHGWQRKRILNFAKTMSGMHDGPDLIADQWTDFWTRYIDRIESTGLDPETVKQELDHEKMQEIRRLADDVVTDGDVAEALKPYYNFWCKRPLFSDEYLQTFNRPNVTLVNTDGHGVDRITKTGVVFGDRRYDVDCIIFASGFRAKIPPNESGDFVLLGRDGLDMSEKWRSEIRSLHGMYSHGFPNLFIIGGVTDASSSPNFTHLLTEQADHLTEILSWCVRHSVRRIEVRDDAEKRWVDTLRDKRSPHQARIDKECTPGYFNNEGNLNEASYRASVYGGGPLEFFDLCRRWRHNGFEGDFTIIKDSDLSI
jgi:cyclohexanone monooxygenase